MTQSDEIYLTESFFLHDRVCRGETLFPGFGTIWSFGRSSRNVSTKDKEMTVNPLESL